MGQAAMTSIEVEDVSAAYDGTPVLHHLSLRVPGGAWVALIGPNGAGKTTLLRAVAGLMAYSGAIRLGEAPAHTLRKRRLARLVAYVPQRPNLPDSMTVADYALLGRTPYIPYLGTETRDDIRVVTLTLERLDLTELAGRPLGSLSGGEVQRAVLARALAQQAPVLLLDEPTAALDVGHQQQVLELIDRLRVEHRLTVLTAMHDLSLAGQFANELLLIDAGQTVAQGPAAHVLTERVIADHYGATVRVEHDARGGVVVIPTRPSASRLAGRPEGRGS
jgi:iron complex transport system ATP-binding protein